MSDSSHIFKLKLPNGAEVHIEGTEKFVSERYSDIRTAAVTLFNREAARTSKEDALDRMLGNVPTEPMPAEAVQMLPGAHGSVGPSATKSPVGQPSPAQPLGSQTSVGGADK